MKPSIVSPFPVIGSLLLLLLLLSPPALAQEQNPETLLQAAINAELIEGDLDKAIRLYQQIYDQFSGHRTIAAQALLRLGQSYEKLGNQQAKEVYERLIREYADQGTIVAEARARLQMLATGTASTLADAPVARQLLEDLPNSFGQVLRGGVHYVYGNNDGDIEVRNLVTGKIRALTTDGNWQTVGTEGVIFCVPSPSGQNIAFEWQVFFPEDGHYENELRTMSISGGSTRTVYRCAENEEIVPADWTPDGRRIVAYRYTPARRMTDSEMLLISVTDGRSRVIAELGENDPNWIARVSPDGRFIAREARPAGAFPREIVVNSIDGATENYVTHSNADDGLLGWSPDGSMLLFTSDRQNDIGIWGIVIDDGKPVGDPILLSPGAGRIRPLGISREGTLFYSISFRVSRLLLGTLNQRKSGLVDEPVLLGEGRAYGVGAFSPDGKELLYFFSPPASYPLINIRSLETGRTRTIRPDLSRLGETVWSPDMASLLTLGRREDTGEGLYQIDLTTGRVELKMALEEGTPRPSRMIWLRDGREIIYSTSDPGNTDRAPQDRIYRIVRRSLDTGGEEELYRGNTRTQGMAVSPDEKWLVYSIRHHSGPMTEWGDEIWLLSLDNGETREISFVRNIRLLYDLVWSDDGSEIFTILKTTERVITPTDTTLVSHAEFCRIPFAGGDPIKTPLDLDDDLALAYLSPGGRRVVYSTHKDMFRDELWSLSNFLPVRDRER